MKKKPEEILKLAVKRMLPDGPLAKKATLKIKNLQRNFSSLMNHKIQKLLILLK